MTDQLHDDLARALEEIIQADIARQHGASVSITDIASEALSRYREAKEGEEDVEYHFLKFDEIIMPGDEVFSPHDKKWILSNNIGMRCGMISLDYRRPIRKEQQPNSSNQTL
jgi:hypothetical protein